jgi:hypothetical protein
MLAIACADSKTTDGPGISIRAFPIGHTIHSCPGDKDKAGNVRGDKVRLPSAR